MIQLHLDIPPAEMAVIVKRWHEEDPDRAHVPHAFERWVLRKLVLFSATTSADRREAADFLKAKVKEAMSHYKRDGKSPEETLHLLVRYVDYLADEVRYGRHASEETL